MCPYFIDGSGDYYEVIVKESAKCTCGMDDLLAEAQALGFTYTEY